MTDNKKIFSDITNHIASLKKLQKMNKYLNAQSIKIYEVGGGLVVGVHIHISNQKQSIFDICSLLGPPLNHLYPHMNNHYIYWKIICCYMGIVT